MLRKMISMLLVVFLIFAISHSVYASHMESTQASQSMAITSATVTFDLKKKDTLILKGMTGSLSLTGATSVIFEAGPFKQEITLDKFKKSKKKYTFTAAAGKAGLGSLILDMAKGKFSAKVRKLLLTGFTNPLPVSLTAGTSAECSMIQFGVNKNKWTFSESKNPQYGCLISQTPQATPKGLFVNKAKDVTVQVQVPSHPDLNQNTIGLFRVDSNLNILSGPHCGLLDNGSLLNGDQTAGDRIFSCLANLQETTAGKMFLMVGAELGGKMTYSPSFSLDVVVPYTEQEAQQTVASHQQAGETWQDNLTRYGDTKKARKETVKTVKAMEGVKDAGVSSDGVNIWIEFTSGIRGGLILSQEEGPSGTARPFVEGKERAVMKMTASPLSVQPASCKQESDTAGGTSSAGTVGNCKVLIWDFWPRKPDDVDSSAFESNPNQIFQINKEYGESCTVDSLRGITKYGTVIIRTSGQKGRVGPIYLTDEPATLQKLNEEKYMLDFLTGCLEAWIDMDQEWKFYFTPSFISTLEGQFNQSIVYVEAQHSSELASAFLRKGAYTFFGYSTGDILHYHWMLDTRNKLFTSMVKDGMDTGEAYAALSKTSEEDSLFLKYSSSVQEIAYGNNGCYYLMWEESDFPAGSLYGSIYIQAQSGLTSLSYQVVKPLLSMNTEITSWVSEKAEAEWKKTKDGVKELAEQTNLLLLVDEADFILIGNESLNPGGGYAPGGQGYFFYKGNIIWVSSFRCFYGEYDTNCEDMRLQGLTLNALSALFIEEKDRAIGVIAKRCGNPGCID